MEKLQRLREHPVVVILIWIPAIALLPGDWITIGGAVTGNANLTRLVIAVLGLAAILIASGRVPSLSRSGSSADSFPPRPPTEGAPEATDPCGHRLGELRQSARLFGHHLENFEHSWHKIKKQESARDDAMLALLYSFARFFSVAWTYQSFCRGHAHRDEVIECVDGVYNALGEPLQDQPGLRLDSGKLHKIGERSTWRWATAEARPFTLAEFEDELEKDNSPLVKRLVPLEAFLYEAGPSAESRAILDAAAPKVRHVEKKLKEMRYSR